MVITGLTIGSVLGFIGIWIYSDRTRKAERITGICVTVAGTVVIVGVFAVGVINYKGNPYQESLDKYYSEECKPLVLSDGVCGKFNIINFNETILQVDAAEYDAAVRAYRKSAQTQN